MNKILSILIGASILIYGNCDDSVSEEVIKGEETALIDETLSLNKPLLISPTLNRPTKYPLASVGLSMIFPGLGHLYLDDYSTARDLGGIAAAEFATLSLSDDESTKFNAAALYSNTYMYSLYAVYRDTRAYNFDKKYLFQMPQDTFYDISMAPFKWTIMKKPEVWGGIIGFLSAAVGISYLTAPKLDSSGNTNHIPFPAIAFPVGIGEESFFRGVMQPVITEYTKSPIIGNIITSLLFTAVHVPNGDHFDSANRNHFYKVGLPIIGSASLYFGWLAQKNNSLQESVAVHAWYDFFLFAGAYATKKVLGEGNAHFKTSIPF